MSHKAAEESAEEGEPGRDACLTNRLLFDLAIVYCLACLSSLTGIG